MFNRDNLIEIIANKLFILLFIFCKRKLMLKTRLFLEVNIFFHLSAPFTFHDVANRLKLHLLLFVIVQIFFLLLNSNFVCRCLRVCYFGYGTIAIRNFIFCYMNVPNKSSKKDCTLRKIFVATKNQKNK